MAKFDIQSLTELPEVAIDEISDELSATSTQNLLSIVVDAVNSSVNGLIITDLKGIIYYANPACCRMLGYTNDEILCTNSADLFSTKEVKSLSDVLSIIDIGSDNTQEFIVESKIGKQFIVEVSASNVTSKDGIVVGRMASFVDITDRKKVELDRENLITKLQEALDKIKMLQGIIPICCSCKKIRDDKGFWNQIEQYISKHSDAIFSHGICPDCAKKLYPDVFG